MNLENISPEFARDLIELVNNLRGLQKTAAVSYGNMRFHYVPLDDILAKVKDNSNFAFMQPLGTMEEGIPCIKCLLIHKSGQSIISDPYPLRIKEGEKKQDEGAEITYSRRYCAASFFGIASDDDTDANNEGNPTREERPRQQQRQQQRPPVPTLPPKKALTSETRAELNRLIKECRAAGGDNQIVKKLEAKIGKTAGEFSEADGVKAIMLLIEWLDSAKKKQVLHQPLKAQ